MFRSARLSAVTGIALAILRWCYDPMSDKDRAPCPPNNSEAVIILPDGATIQAKVKCLAKDRVAGLQNRSALPSDRGMLIQYPASGRHRHWMYLCKIPLDIIWLNERKEIVEMVTAAPPRLSATPADCPHYGTVPNARYVLELAAHQARAHSLRLSQQLRWHLRNAEPAITPYCSERSPAC